MSRGKSAGAVRIDFIASSAEFVQGVKKNMSAMDRFKHSARRLAMSIKKNWRSITLAVGAFVAGVGIAMKKMSDYSAKLVEVSRTTGTTVKQLESMRSLFKGDGIGIERTDKALQEFNVRLGFAQRGIGQYKRAFEGLGITLTRADGSFKSQVEVLAQVAEGLKNTKSESKAASFAYELLGRSGKDLIPILRKYGKSLEDAAKYANRWHTISDDQHETNKQLNQDFTDLEDNVVDFVQRALSPMADETSKIIEHLNQAVRNMKPIAEGFGEVIAQIMDGWRQLLVGAAGMVGFNMKTVEANLDQSNIKMAGYQDTLNQIKIEKAGGTPEYSSQAKAIRNRMGIGGLESTTRNQMAGERANNTRLAAEVDRNKKMQSLVDELSARLDGPRSGSEDESGGASASTSASTSTSTWSKADTLLSFRTGGRTREEMRRADARRKAEAAQRRGDRSFRDALWQDVYDFNTSAQADPGQFAPMRYVGASKVGRASRPYQGRHYDTDALRLMMESYDPSTFIRDRRNDRAAANAAAFERDEFTTMIENALHGPIDSKPAGGARYHHGGVQFGEGVLEAFERAGKTNEWYKTLEATKDLSAAAATNAKHSYDIVRMELTSVDRRGRSYSAGDIARMGSSDIRKWGYEGRVYSPIERIRMNSHAAINRGGPYAGREYGYLDTKRMNDYQSVFTNTAPYAGRSYSHGDRVAMSQASIHGVNEGEKYRLEQLLPVVKDVRSEFEGWFGSMFDGFTNTRDALEDMLGMLAKIAAQRVVLEPLANVLFGSGGSSDRGGLLGSVLGGAGSFFGSLFNPFSGGKGVATLATGGLGNGLALVGEEGPELVDFSRPGMVYNNEQLRQAIGGGGGGITIVNNINSTDGPGVQRALGTAMPGIVAAAQSAVAESARRPGAFRNAIQGV